MTITVVIPTLNEETTIAATLHLTVQAGVDEIIVVDGGSTDRTRAIVKSFQFDDRTSEGSRSSLVSRRSQDASREALHASRVLLESVPGRAKQLNAGAEVASGDVVLFLHADTHLPPSVGSRIEAALADGRAVGGRFDVQFDSRSLWGSVVGSLMNLRSRVTGICTGDQALFVRKSVFTRLRGFTDISLMEDVEFTTRLKREGRIVALHDRVTTSFRRWEQGGPLRTIFLMWALRFLYWIGVSPHRLARLYTTVR